MQIASTRVDMSSANPRDFIRLLMENERRLFAYLRSLVGNADDAEDLLQETSIVLWDKFDEFDQESGNFVAWSFKVAFFMAQNFRRKRGRSRLIFSEQVFEAISDQTHPLIDELDRRNELLDDCIEKLPSKDRQLLVLRYQQESSIERTAKASGRSVPAVYKALSRMRANLFECISRGLSLENLS